MYVFVCTFGGVPFGFVCSNACLPVYLYLVSERFPKYSFLKLEIEMYLELSFDTVFLLIAHRFRKMCMAECFLGYVITILYPF